MRNLVCHVLAFVALAACGPSSGELKSARTAHYTGDKLAIFNAAKAATEAAYKIDTTDEGALGFKTLGRWYNPEGQLAAEGNTNAQKSGGYNTPYPDHSLNLVFVVGMKADGESWIVEVKPVIERYIAGSPKTEPLTEDDISVPGWVHGKIEKLTMDIHDGLKPYEVKTLPAPAGSTPAPAPAPTGSATPVPVGPAGSEPAK